MHWRHKRHVSITTTPCWGSRLVALRARVVLAGRIGAQPLSKCAGPGQPGGKACRVCPSGCMLGDGARGSATFDPQRRWAPFCDVICIRSLVWHAWNFIFQFNVSNVFYLWPPLKFCHFCFCLSSIQLYRKCNVAKINWRLLVNHYSIFFTFIKVWPSLVAGAASMSSTALSYLCCLWLPSRSTLCWQPRRSASLSSSSPTETSSTWTPSSLSSWPW